MTIEHQIKYIYIPMFSDTFLLIYQLNTFLIKKQIVLQGPIGVAGLKGGRGTQGAPVG